MPAVYTSRLCAGAEQGIKCEHNGQTTLGRDHTCKGDPASNSTATAVSSSFLCDHKGMRGRKA
jgi:hypothetical protein